MNAFASALSTIVNDANLGVDVIYMPANAAPIPCRGAFVQPDIQPTIGSSLRVSDRRRGLMVLASDIAAPAVNDTVTIGAATYRVVDFTARDPQRMSFHLQLAAI